MKFLAKVWLVLRVYWSNIRNRSDIATYTVMEKVNSTYSLSLLSKKLYTGFTYKYDSALELFDSMHSPAYCYRDLVGGHLKDDCDGYHAAMYHIAENNGLDAYLLTYITKDIESSHTILVINKSGLWFGLDYDRYIPAVYTIDEIINRDDILAYNLVKFDYKNKRYYISKGE